MDDRARIEMLETENALLRERVALLEESLTPALIDIPVEWRLTRAESVVVGVLLSRELATKDAVMAALYSARIDDDIDPKIVDVFVCRVRKKLKPFGVDIQTIWGRGWTIAEDVRRRHKRRELVSEGA